jgi:putative heme-binding domain-containing protein
VRSSSADKKQEIARLQAILIRETDPATIDFQKGRGLYTQRCSACHELFGEGGKVGPNLTGSDRKNVGYLLENIVDPSASVPGDYQMSIVSMKDGRVLTGAVMNRRDPVVRLRMMAEELKIDGNEIDEIKGLGMSLMPEGLLNGLSEEDLVDLFGYLRSQ